MIGYSDLVIGISSFVLKLKDKYNTEVIPEMMKKFGYRNMMAVPKIKEVIINTGFGKSVADKTSDEQKKITDSILTDLAKICGQQPVLSKSKKSISGFKIRKGQPIGAKVTLRRKKMYDFLERLINITLPRSRDFRGINLSSIDKKGNLTIGIQEHIAFPEISPEEIKLNFGMEITIVSTAKNREEGLDLLRLLGVPIKLE